MPDVWSEDSASPKGFIETDEGVGRKNRRGELTRTRAKRVPELSELEIQAASDIGDDVAEHISYPCSKKGKEYDHRNAHEQDQQRVLNEPLALRERKMHECPQ